MCRHEEKKCSRCGSSFECKVGDIANCQCVGIQLTLEERAFIEERYDECLCIACLLQIKQRYILFREKYLLKSK